MILAHLKIGKLHSLLGQPGFSVPGEGRQLSRGALRGTFPARVGARRNTCQERGRTERTRAGPRMEGGGEGWERTEEPTPGINPHPLNLLPSPFFSRSSIPTATFPLLAPTQSPSVSLFPPFIHSHPPPKTLPSRPVTSLRSVP